MLYSIATIDSIPVARVAWLDWIDKSARFETSNYVVLESHSLLQKRLGLEAVRVLHRSILPLLNIHWIDPVRHEQGITALFTANRRDLSLVDCTSFIVMYELGLNVAFTFDAHFADQGFSRLPTIPGER